jgi:hypothetical protein
MSKAGLVFAMGAVSLSVAAACSGDDGTGLTPIPDGATDGSSTGGRGAGTGGRSAGGSGTGGRGTGGSSTGGASDSGAAGATGGRDAASGAGGDSGIRDGSDSSLNPDGAKTDSGTDSAAEAAAPGCPSAGKYSFTFSGSGCGDLDGNAPDERYDGFNCAGRFEYDNGGSKGVTGSTITFASDGGVLSPSPLTIGSATMSCTGQATTATVKLVCAGDAGTCSIQMTRTGPL